MRSEKMKIRMWIRTLLPFWIYFGCLAVGSFLLLAFPLVLFLLLSLAVIWLVLWAVIVYLIGGEVQRRTEAGSRRGRIGTAFFCSFLVTLVLPASVMVYEGIHGEGWSIIGFLLEYASGKTIIFLLVHFLLFWLGETVEKLGQN